MKAKVEVFIKVNGCLAVPAGTRRFVRKGNKRFAMTPDEEAREFERRAVLVDTGNFLPRFSGGRCARNDDYVCGHHLPETDGKNSIRARKRTRDLRQGRRLSDKYAVA